MSAAWFISSDSPKDAGWNQLWKLDSDRLEEEYLRLKGAVEGERSQLRAIVELV